MTRVRVRSSGLILYLEGKAPARAGDKFTATRATPVQTGLAGCALTRTEEGAAFTCRRKSSPRLERAPSATYRFDPALHELLP